MQQPREPGRENYTDQEALRLGALALDNMALRIAIDTSQPLNSAGRMGASASIMRHSATVPPVH
jgi:hypothetical protein